MDETGFLLVPASRYVLAEKGVRRVARQDADERRQLTGVIAHTMQGDMLPVQCIYNGKTARVLPHLPPALTRDFKP